MSGEDDNNERMARMNKIFIALTIWLTGQSAFAQRLTCNRNTSSYDCLVCNCYHESRGEPFDGRVAVLKTVFSRHEDEIYPWPDTICGIVYQDGQYSWTQDKYSNNITTKNAEDVQSLNECRRAADVATDEGGNGMIFFNNPRTSDNAWKFKRGKTECGRIGQHVFYVPRGQQCPKKLGANGGSSSQQQKSNNGGTAR